LINDKALPLMSNVLFMSATSITGSSEGVALSHALSSAFVMIILSRVGSLTLTHAY